MILFLWIMSKESERNIALRQLFESLTNQLETNQVYKDILFQTIVLSYQFQPHCLKV